AKQHLAGDGIHYEPRWFKPWPRMIHAEHDIAGDSYPIGDIFFDVGGVKIGFEICEDAWVGTRPGASLAARGVDVILNPSASHFEFGKNAVRQRFVLEGSRAFNVNYVYSNLLGNEAGRSIYDGGGLIAAAGRFVAEGARLSFQPVTITSATIDIDATRMTRARSGSFEPEVDGDESDVVKVPFVWPNCKPAAPVVKPATWESSAELKCEEFSRAVALALFDYLRKSRSDGFVVSLSGGVDSASVVVLVRTMIDLALKELSGPEFAARLRVQDFPPQADAAWWCQRLLTTVYQKTRNNSDVTENAARQVAEAIGAKHYQLEIDAIVDHFVEAVGAAIGRPLKWPDDDLPLQNVQARSRSPAVWLLANLKNALLLATSNRSEVGVGYCTMDGDTSGGLSPLAGIDKHFLRHWLRWMESTGVTGLRPWPELSAVNRQTPTAELRPLADKQTDEGDLMPYEILDRIERLAIRDKLMPIDIWQRLAAEYADVGGRTLAGWIAKFFRLWCRNQWKRERLAPSFHLDDENLDPKTWCRFPILSGGFERELQELQDYVEQAVDEKP
ncbi:MAG TPA: NAD(+) synthase, partial [Pirellulaceae bacterium]|nr:NAD(+) synthase [Pirellulaceae bacterium]